MVKIIPVSYNMDNKVIYEKQWVQPNTPIRNGRWKIRLRGKKARERRRLRIECPTGMSLRAFIRSRQGQ